MNETDQALQDEALWFARSLQISGALDHEARIRLDSFRPTIRHQYQCPRCWIKRDLHSTLRSLPGTDEHDILKCNSPRCGAEFVIPF